MRAQPATGTLGPPETPPPDRRPRRGARWAAALALLVVLGGTPPVYSQLELAPLWHDVLGVDVSAHQGDIDWERLAGSRVAFAYIKATEGMDFRDARFPANWAASRRAGIHRGAYHYFTNCGSGAAQAQNFISAVPVDPEALPAVVDAEHLAPCRSGPGIAAPAAELRIFIDLLQQRYGRRPIVYTTRAFEAAHLRGELMGESFWLRSLFFPPRYRAGQWVLWQYHHRGRRPGIAGPVDLDAFHGTRSEFEAWAGAD